MSDYPTLLYAEIAERHRLDAELGERMREAIIVHVQNRDPAKVATDPQGAYDETIGFLRKANKHWQKQLRANHRTAREIVAAREADHD